VKPPDGYDNLSIYIIAEFPYPNEETKQSFKSDYVNVTGPNFCASMERERVRREGGKEGRYQTSSPHPPSA
jgi:hypothetical protein